MKNRFSGDEINKAVKNGSADGLLSKLTPEERSRLSTILSDRKQLEQILKSDQAKQIMKLFGSEKNKNG